MSDRHRLEHRRSWDKEVDESQSLPPRRSGCLDLRKIHSFRFIVTTRNLVWVCFLPNLADWTRSLHYLPDTVVFEKGSVRWRRGGNVLPPPRWKPASCGPLHVSARGIRNQAILPLVATPSCF